MEISSHYTYILPFEKKFDVDCFNINDVMNVQISHRYFVLCRQLIVLSKGNPSIKFFIVLP